mgnify:CR=1 FL=1
MTKERELKEEIRRVIETNNLMLSEDELDKVTELAMKLKVSKRQDVLRNFIAAYMRVFYGLTAKEADQIASSSKGRREWEEKIRQAK